MRSTTTRFFATVKSAAKYLEAGTPTGLTGLITHPCPRPALLYTYRTTLDRLAQLPANSVYRQSVEALTKQRMSVVESQKPAGYDEWLGRITKQLEAHPDAYKQYVEKDGTLNARMITSRGSVIWDGQHKRGDFLSEGANSQREADAKAAAVEEEVREVDSPSEEQPTLMDLETEPALDSEQISSIESQLAAGLIEEVLQVAEGELKVVDQMLESRSWEPLEEQAPPGQWEYFERGDRV